MFLSFSNIYLYIYISTYIYIYLYIYIEKRTERSEFFCKRTKRSRVLLHSLRSFTFFAKERCVLLKSLQKNVAFFALFSIL